MGLELIVGPPNSGRAGAVLDRFAAAIDRGPLLVVPTRDDVDRFERELCARPGGMLGGTVTSFPGLFGEVATAFAVDAGAPLTRVQRVWIARAAAAQSDLRLLRRSAGREGFAPALEQLIGDLQAAGLDAAGFAATVEGLEEDAEATAPYERELAALFAAYERIRDRLGRSDEHGVAARATAALRADPASWGDRPVLLYGFDDLAREQVELLAALAAACEVTVAIAYEDRPALAARAELIGVLGEELGGTVASELGPDRGHTASPTLFHLERHLFDPEPATAACDEALTLLESAGERGEAELIGRRVAERIAAGCDPDEIAISVRSPDRQAPLLARVLAGLGIPVAAEARIALAATATGSTLLRLLAIAGGEGTAADVVAYLRGPARAAPANVDWLERRVLRDRLESAEQALAAWEERGGHEIRELAELQRAGDRPAALAAALTRVAAGIAERPHRRAGTVPSAGAAVELRAAREVAAALAEAAELGALAPGRQEVAELLGHVRVPLWRGATEGRVRILSPYRLRATRVAELFVAGLVDGAFPAPGGGDPLLSESRRRALGLPSRRDPAAEERYLFYSCVSRPRRHLYLSYASSDESGATLARSPFVDEVRALLDPPPDPSPARDSLERRITDRIGVGEIAVEPELASSPRALARALAALPPSVADRRLRALELPAPIRAEVGAALARGRDNAAAAAAPGPLTHPEVLAAIAERELYGASTLEEFDTCPYRWFVAHELRPQRIEPDPEGLENGGIVHAALERLYRDPPAGARPEPERIGAWTRAAGERLREVAAERGWELDSARARITLARLDAVLARFLRRDAETGGPMLPDPDLLEASFGDDPADAFPAADLGTFKLRGRVDRIDVSTDRKALVRDYKLSAGVVAAKKLIDEGKLQLPLYLEAVKGMGLEPIGGLYHPLAASREDRPRGLLAQEERGELLPAGTAFNYGTDFLDAEERDEIVTAATDRARAIVASIRAGAIDRRPRGGACPTWCGFAPICRMERGIVEPDPEEEERDR
jgi:ATP-dependent helicase/DNAse subunit B